MLNVQVKRFVGIRPYDDDVASHEAAMESLRFQVKVPPAWQDYRAMVDACSDAAQPLVDTLHGQGFHIWLFLIGGNLTAEFKKRIPNYNLAGPAERQSLLTERRMERVFALPAAAERTAGFYQVELDKFHDVCRFMESAAWSALILSQRNEFLSEENLTRAHNGGGFESEGKAPGGVYWRRLAEVVCPMGDIVVRVLGAFDDKERGIIFVHDSRNDDVRRSVAQVSSSGEPS